MGSKRRVNPYPDTDAYSQKAWTEGYTAADASHDCTTEIQAHVHGVKAGRALAADEFGERLILMAQEYGAAQFVFTHEDLEALQLHTDELANKLARIETLR